MSILIRGGIVVNHDHSRPADVLVQCAADPTHLRLRDPEPEAFHQLIDAPRHLSQHPGGFVLSLHRLDELVPIEPAAMENRQVIEWDKDDIDALGFMKVDVLGLGMLGCMRRAFDLLEAHKGIKRALARLTHYPEPN